MITKTEVLSAIARVEPHAGFATIDNALVHPGAISRGDLRALIEAAKCARYKNTSHYTAASGADWALDDETRKPVHHYDQDDDE